MLYQHRPWGGVNNIMHNRVHCLRYLRSDFLLVDLGKTWLWPSVTVRPTILGDRGAAQTQQLYYTDVYKVYLYQHQVADPNVYQDSVLNCNTEWQSAIDIHHRSNQSGLGRYNRYTYLRVYFTYNHIYCTGSYSCTNQSTDTVDWQQ